MSEQRFKKGINLSCVDIETGKSYWYACNLCGLLNNLVEENNKLDKDNLDLILINFKQIKERLKLMNDNEQLKQENEKLQKENDALKSFIKDNFSEMMDSKMVIENEQDY